jgi:hypothetical protein
MPLYSLATLFSFVAAVCFALAFPRYVMLVTGLFLSVLGLLAILGAIMGPLPKNKRPGVAKVESKGRPGHNDEA